MENKKVKHAEVYIRDQKKHQSPADRKENSDETNYFINKFQRPAETPQTKNGITAIQNPLKNSRTAGLLPASWLSGGSERDSADRNPDCADPTGADGKRNAGHCRDYR